MIVFPPRLSRWPVTPSGSLARPQRERYEGATCTAQRAYFFARNQRQIPSEPQEILQVARERGSSLVYLLSYCSHREYTSLRIFWIPPHAHLIVGRTTRQCWSPTAHRGRVCESMYESDCLVPRYDVPSTGTALAETWLTEPIHMNGLPFSIVVISHD